MAHNKDDNPTANRPWFGPIPTGGDWNLAHGADPDVIDFHRYAAGEPEHIVLSSGAFAPGRSPSPVGTFPPPALRTRRADFRHRALQWNHAARTRASGCDQRAGLASRGTRLAPWRWPAGASSDLLTP